MSGELLSKRSRSRWENRSVQQIHRETMILRNALPYTIILLSILVAAGIYLWPAPLEFPMDDAYIHFVYAENLSETGRLFFNSPDEAGVGTSSLLWVLILAGGDWAGLPLHWVAKLAGLASLIALGIGLFHLLRPLLPTWAALITILLVVLSGHMLWFALSGMETILFLALGIAALLCYREERWVLLGIFLGLLILTRIEGFALAFVIAGFDIWRVKTIRSGLLVTGLVSGLICFPWILYMWLRTGHMVPTSGIGRRFSNILAIKIATENNQALSFMKNLPALAYPLVYIGYIVEFVLGGYALPAPYLAINLGVGSLSYRLSLWAILGLIAIVLPLTWISFERFVNFLKIPQWVKVKDRLPLILLMCWMILHNVCYMIYLPIIGSASRYASLNHIALWLSLGFGIWFTQKSRYRIWFAFGLITLAMVNTVYWNRVYDANLEHMTQVRIRAAKYLAEQNPENGSCAAMDIGALRYYSQQPLIDLGGLIDPGLSQWFLDGKMDQYLLDHQVTCLALPGMIDADSGGVFNLPEELGFTQSSHFELRKDKVFDIQPQRWLFGYLPTVNYQATVEIYTLLEKENKRSIIR